MMTDETPKRKVWPIDAFANQCGYFYNAYLSDGISANNGYNCRHPDQEQVHDGVGMCYCWGCPLGYEADEEDFMNQNVDTDGYEFEEGEFIIPDESMEE